MPSLLLRVPQDVLVLNYKSVALHQTEFDHDRVLFEETFPHSVEFIRELFVQDAEFDEALTPLFVVYRKAAQSAHEITDFLSKCLNDRILRSLTLA